MRYHRRPDGGEYAKVRLEIHLTREQVEAAKRMCADIDPDHDWRMTLESIAALEIEHEIEQRSGKKHSG